MPHVPTRRAPTSGVPPELLSPPRDRPPVPVRAADPPAGGPRATKKLGLATINPHTYEPDTGLALRCLFGKEPDVDPHTGGLVYRPAPAAAPVPGPGR